MDIILNVLNQTLVFTIPLLVVALGGMFSERSGVVNIALEGIMIGGAFVGVYFIYLMQLANASLNPQLLLILALIVAGVFGALLSLLHAFAAINLKADQTISGTAINMLAPGLGLFLAKLIFNGNSSVPFSNTFRIHEIPVLSQIPILGPILFKGAYITTYLGIIILILSVSPGNLNYASAVSLASPSFSAICLITRAKLAIGDWMLPRNLDSRTSLLGIVAITLIPFSS